MVREQKRLTRGDTSVKLFTCVAPVKRISSAHTAISVAAMLVCTMTAREITVITKMIITKICSKLLAISVASASMIEPSWSVL